MFIHAFITSIRTRPKPTVLPFLDGLNEIFANFVGRRFRVSVFTQDDLSQFLLVPVVHLVFLFLFLLRLSIVDI